MASRDNEVCGLRISSAVIPSATFIMPLTGGSPFRTNSYCPSLCQLMIV